MLRRWGISAVCALVAVAAASGCGGGDSQPQFGELPDVAFYAETDTVRVYDIFVASQGKVTQLTNDKLSYGPAWSPDGDRIAFVRGKPGSAEECCGYGSERIWVMDADGSNAEPVSTSDPTSSPQWTPDGTAVLFTVASGTTSGPPPWEDASEIVQVDLASGEQTTVLADLPQYDFMLSPDGESIVTTGRRAVIVTTLTDGKETTEAAGVFKGGPGAVSWSPDGEWLAVSGSAEGTEDDRLWGWNLAEDRLVPIEIGRGGLEGFTWVGPSELLYCYTAVVGVKQDQGFDEAIYEHQLRRVAMGDELVEEAVTEFADDFPQGDEPYYCLGSGMDARMIS